MYRKVMEVLGNIVTIHVTVAELSANSVFYNVKLAIKIILFEWSPTCSRKAGIEWERPFC